MSLSLSLSLVHACFLEAVGHNGNVHAKRAKIDTPKNGFGPSNTIT